MVELLRHTWWSLALRGLAALVFALIIFFWPGFTVELLVVLFGIYCLVDGAWMVIGVLTKRKTNRSSWLLMLEGLTTILLGIITLVWPGLTVFLLIYLVAIKALLMGAFNIYAGVRLIGVGASGWLSLFIGVAAVIFGGFIFFNPESIVWFVGVFALFVGIFLIALAFQVRGWEKHDEATHIADGA